MSRFYSFLKTAVFLLVLTAFARPGAFAQVRAALDIRNVRIRENTLCWDIYFIPGSGWGRTGGAALGNASWYFRYPEEGLYDPEIAASSSAVDPSAGYSASIGVAGHRMGITTRLEADSPGVPLEEGETYWIYSVRMKIRWPLRMGLSWDRVNTGIYDSNDHYVLELYQESGGLDQPWPAPQSVPDRFDLGLNYPNPFNAETTLVYQLPEDAEVTLTIYDITGRAVEKAFGGWQEAGFYMYTWDGREQGRPAGSGIYFLNMEANGFSKTIRMILTR